MAYETQNWNSGVFPTTWTNSGFSETNAQSYSPIYSVKGTLNAESQAIFNTPDTNGGNQLVEVKFRSDPSSRAGVQLRHNGAALASRTCYMVSITLYGSAGNNGLSVQKYVSGAVTVLGPQDLFASSFSNAGIWYLLSVTVTGTTTTTITADVQRLADSLWLQSDGSWGPVRNGAIVRTDPSSPITGASRAGLYAYSNGNYLDDFNFDLSSITAAFAASPATIPSNATSTVALSGSSTNWTSGTTFTLSGTASAGASLTKSFASSTSYTLTVTTGSATGNLTVTDGNGVATTVVVGTAVLPNSASVAWSPGVGFDASNFCPVTYNGTYFKTSFTGTSLTLVQDLSTYKANAISAGGWGDWLVSVDGGSLAALSLTDPGSTNQLYQSLASGLAPGSHTIQAWRQIYDETDTFTPKSVTLVEYLMLDAGASFSAPGGLVAKRPKKAVLLGDSITKGYNASHPALGATNFPHQAFPLLVGVGLNAEIGQVGLSGQGWSVTGGSSGGNTFVQTWNKCTSTVNRPLTGLDYLIVCHGANDGSTNIQATVVTWLGNARAAVGPSCWILICTPFTNAYGANANLPAAVATYQSANPGDARVALINTNNVLPITSTAGGGSLYKLEGTHPNNIGMAWGAAAMVGLIKDATNAGGVATFPVLGSSIIRGL